MTAEGKKCIDCEWFDTASCPKCGDVAADDTPCEEFSGIDDD